MTRAQFALRQGLERILAPFELRRVQFTLLLLLKYNPGERPSVIAESLGIKRANMVVLVDELQLRGYVAKIARVGDARSLSLTLTATGSALIARAEQAVDEYERRLHASIAPGQPGLADTLWQALRTLPGYTD